jgi:hypothetical protein
MKKLLGAGIGLLLSSRLAPRHRRALRFALFAIGAASTVRGMMRRRKEVAF